MSLRNPIAFGLLGLAALMSPTAILAQEEPAADAAAASLTADDGNMEASVAAGEELYLVNCRQCHGTKGTAGTPLKGNENLADAEHVANTIITGPGYMTEFGPVLSDEEIATIATFVRNSWGNSYGPVTPEEVASVR